MKMQAAGKSEGCFLSAEDNKPITVPRDELLKQFRAGNLPAVRVAARVFLSGPNKNHVVIPDSELEAFAATFVDKPFLRDHDYTQLAVGGTIVQSEVVEESGRKVIRQVLEAVKPWAVESLLDKTIQRFSIGWDSQRQVCTSCEEDFFSKKCGHAIYDLGKEDPETKKTVLIRTEGNEGVETSAVVHPAVPGTGVEAMRTLKANILAEMAQEKHEDDEMKQVICKMLGINPETPDADVEKALEAKFATPAVPAAITKALGCDATAPTDAIVAEVVKLTAPGAYVAKGEHDKVVSELTSLKADTKVAEMLQKGKITPAQADWARKLYVENPSGFDAFFTNAPTITPIGTTPPPVVTTDPKKEDGEVTDVAALMGCTKEMLAKFDKSQRKEVA